jgi:hypothetical protein
VARSSGFLGRPIGQGSADRFAQALAALDDRGPVKHVEDRIAARVSAECGFAPALERRSQRA